ncbi:hypothetical protein KI809_12455 [Geobacter pelophilus]|uniref:Uncharacterized protein n=1 Tax=Geoanaerobacter pelophilus TaxID=60036 RepID=A0AAW4L965_9BACT|nr:hypothetical protein [Geoanaerobacter pelophilus]MBT0665110.1 hypothetical protein [Geoanaerobacter pelophilus]
MPSTGVDAVAANCAALVKPSAVCARPNPQYPNPTSTIKSSTIDRSPSQLRGLL